MSAKACLAVLSFIALTPVLFATTSLPTPKEDSVFDMRVLVEGLQQPDGLAVHPGSGELYVSEESAGRINVIRNGRAQHVVGPTIAVKDDLPDWAVTRERPREKWLQTTLLSPEGIAFDQDGALYVAEDAPGGRILRFAMAADGTYKTATVVPVPDLSEDFAWESVSVTQDGRIFLAGSSYEGSRGWGSSCVMTRDAKQNWWIVDFGPMAAFSSVAMSHEEDMLIVGDESVGGLTWWDTERRTEIQTLVRNLSSVEGICLLPDGSLVVAQESVKGSDDGTKVSGGALIRVDPSSGIQTVIAEGLGTLESALYDEKTGHLYVTEDSTGRILAFTSRKPFGARNSLLQVARRSGEARRGLPPRQTPEFLKQFMKQVGVDLVEKSGEQGGAATDFATQTTEKQSFTLEELGQRIPLVAGRVKIEELPGVEDPITEISFINLFPNHMTRINSRPAPSLCLYAARHRSGKIDRNTALPGFNAKKIQGSTGASEVLSNNAMMLVPLATCSAMENENGVNVVMTFLGLDKFEDCFLTLTYGKRNEAYFATAGKTLQTARATFSEVRADGTEVMNFAMTGVRTRRLEDATWLRISNRPVFTLLSPGYDTWVSRWALAQMPDIVAKMRRFNQETMDTLEPVPPQELEVAGQKDRPAKDGTKETETSSVPAPQQDKAVKTPTITQPAPVANIKLPPPPVPEDEQILTNIILSRIAQAWESVHD